MLGKTQRWIEIADEDLNMAEIALEHGRYLHMTFFCQQALEKTFKAFYYEKQEQTPPRKHDLLALAAHGEILDELSFAQKTLLATVSEYYIESRYPEDRGTLAKNVYQRIRQTDLIRNKGGIGMGQKQVEIVVKDYLRTLRENKIAVERAILYGSHAANTAHKDSDIDLAIVSADFGHDYVQEAVRLKMLTLDVDPDISPRPYSIEDYRNAKPGDFLFDEVMQKGKVVL